MPTTTAVIIQLISHSLLPFWTNAGLHCVPWNKAPRGVIVKIFWRSCTLLLLDSEATFTITVPKRFFSLNDFGFFFAADTVDEADEFPACFTFPSLLLLLCVDRKYLDEWGYRNYFCSKHEDLYDKDFELWYRVHWSHLIQEIFYIFSISKIEFILSREVAL